MNTKELQAEAARLNIKGRSKMLKDELVGAILAHSDSRITTNRRGDLTLKEDLQPVSVTDGIVDVDDLVEVEFPRDGLDAQLIDTLDAKAAELVEDMRDRDISIDPVWVDSLTDVQHKLMEEAQERIDTATVKRAEKPSRVMGLHFRGRAMGAKHYALVRAAMLDQQTRADQLAVYADPFMTRDDFRHTPNSERVQKYARQNVAEMFSSHLAPPAKLTHRQMRRVRKNTLKHGEGFKIQHLGSWEDLTPQGHSLLARTPEGLGIFYQFLVA